MHTLCPLHHDPTGVLKGAHFIVSDVRRWWHLPWFTIGFYFTIARRWRREGRYAIDWSWFAIRRSG